MQIPKSTKIGAATDKATLPPQYRFHQRWKNPQSQLNQLELSQLHHYHIRTTKE
jgi:hypothetical protein